MKLEQRQLAEGILLTDQYQLTMAQLYFRQGLHLRPVQFEYFFRSYPDYGSHKAGYCIAAGLGSLLEWMAEARFGPMELELLQKQRGRLGQPLFQPDFLAWLAMGGNFDEVRIRAVPEGRVIHPGVPLAVVEGPLAMVQLLETSLLNHLNYQTLIATKASRICQAALGRPVLEFGLRRAQGYGGIPGVRGALVGGAEFSSAVGVSHALGFDPKGTHAHSMVQAFMALGGTELDAFRAYAEVYPDDCLLLVDTINTLESGLPNAIRVFQQLRRQGHQPIGVRLDSGDLAFLSMRAAQMLDDAGFDQTTIVLSNQLDEMVIWQILSQIRDDAPRYGVDAEAVIQRLVFGVGTALITSHGQGALDGVYKLTAVWNAGQWQPAMKISETPSKTLNPGAKGVWRLYDQRNKAIADVLSLPEEDLSALTEISLQHPIDPRLRRILERADLSRIESLLEPVEYQPELPPATVIDQARQRRLQDLAYLDAGVRRMVNPHIYHVSLTQGLWELKQRLVKGRLLAG